MVIKLMGMIFCSFSAAILLRVSCSGAYQFGPYLIRLGVALACPREPFDLQLDDSETNLARLLARRVDGIFVSDFEQGEIGSDLFRHACLLGAWRAVSKLRESAYRAGRSRRWVKVKNRQHPAFSRVMDQF